MAPRMRTTTARAGFLSARDGGLRSIPFSQIWARAPRPAIPLIVSTIMAHMSSETVVGPLPSNRETIAARTSSSHGKGARSRWPNGQTSLASSGRLCTGDTVRDGKVIGSSQVTAPSASKYSVTASRRKDLLDRLRKISENSVPEHSTGMTPSGRVFPRIRTGGV